MGKIHVYCGEGKGKTTASIGLSIRALGSGYHVIFVQFLKTSQTGELEIFGELDNIEVIRSEKPMKFTFMMNEEELAACRVINDEMFRKVMQMKFTDKTLLVLDESVGTMEKQLLDEELVMNFLQSDPKCEVVLTGRGPSDRLLELADYVTEMKKIKHPYDKEVPARKGIEY
ncbi:MAG: cob(I)yrinic acid a,c-diamide adenosyltransferase [Eubacteriales bacterium]